MTTTMTEPSERVQELWRLREQIKEIQRQIDAASRDDPGRRDLFRARQVLNERLSEVLFEVHDEEADFPLASVEVWADLGFLSSVAQFLRHVREQLGKELRRDDLTPYVWSRLNRRYDAFGVVLGALGGRKLKDDEHFEVVPTHVLFAEHDDGSIDWEEAYSEEEAIASEAALVANGAVVYRYRVYPEMGVPILVHDPIRPSDNRHRPIPPSVFRRIVRLKGGEKFNLPDHLRDSVILDTRYHIDAEDDEDDD